MPLAEEVVEFHDRKTWAAWLKKNHAKSTGQWVRLAKKSSSSPMLAYADALEVALCYGWIDAQKRGESETAWLQRFTPRGQRSIWSKINRAKAIALMESGDMQAAGLREIERAQGDGRWEAAYDSHRTATVPEDLQSALDASPAAKDFFKTLNAANRYAILFRIQTTKAAVTRASRIRKFVEMLERHEVFHPPKQNP